jgi:hypothetical protein
MKTKKWAIVGAVVLLLIAGIWFADYYPRYKSDKAARDFAAQNQKTADAFEAYKESAEQTKAANRTLDTLKGLLAKVRARADKGYSSGAVVNSAMNAFLDAVTEENTDLPWDLLNEKFAFLSTNIDQQMAIYEKEASAGELAKLKLLIEEENSTSETIKSLVRKK